MGWMGVLGQGQHGGHLILNDIITNDKEFKYNHTKVKNTKEKVPGMDGDFRMGPAWGPIDLE